MTHLAGFRLKYVLDGAARSIGLEIPAATTS